MSQRLPIASAFASCKTSSLCWKQQHNSLLVKLEESSAPDTIETATNIDEPQTMDIPEIMALLRRTYPEQHNDSWKKTRNYLYQYRANSRSSKQSTTNRTSELAPIKTKRVRSKNLSLTNIQQIISFLQTNFPDHPELQARILQTSPRILSQYHSIESRLRPTLELLHDLYGKMADSNGVEGGMIYEAIWRNTNLLLVRGVGYGGGWEKRNNTENDLDIEQYLVELGISSSNIAKLKKGHPTLFQASLEQKVKPMVQFLQKLLGYNPTGPISNQHRKQISRIITNHPMLVHLDVETNLKPKCYFIKSFCGMDDHDIATIFSSSPGLLGLSLESNLRPTLQFLYDTLKPNAEQRNITKAITNKNEEENPIALLRKCVLKHPQILGLSLSNIRNKIEYFNEIDSIGSKDPVATKHKRKEGTLATRILLGAPSVYSLSLCNIAEKIEYLAAIWNCDVPYTVRSHLNDTHIMQDLLGNHDGTASLSDNIRTYPQILTLSMEGNIKVRNFMLVLLFEIRE